MHTKKNRKCRRFGGGVLSFSVILLILGGDAFFKVDQEDFSVPVIKEEEKLIFVDKQMNQTVKCCPGVDKNSFFANLCKNWRGFGFRSKENSHVLGSTFVCFS